jgi:O-antigen ligase
MYGPYLASLNAHNQYLSFTINSGVIGLVIYLTTIGWGFWQSIKKKDIILLSFLTLVTVVSFSEDLLDVNKGIFIYAFFFPFLIMSAGRPDT